MEVQQIFAGILSVVSVVVMALIIPLVKTKIEKEKIDKLIGLVDIGVKSAEQIFSVTHPGKQKKEYVKQFLKEQGVNIDDPLLDDMIESCVLELKRWEESIRAESIEE